MDRLGRLLVLALLALPPLLAGAALGQDGPRLRLVLTLDGAAVPWTPSIGEVAGGVWRLPAGTERAEARFAGGALEIAVADVGAWDLAHVLAVGWRTSGAERSFAATVRHRDEGWEHYADLWRVAPADGGEVAGGERVLLHPHDAEQPFTRSLGGVRAAGTVRVEARDLRHGWGGTSWRLELPVLPPAGRLAAELELLDAD